MSDTPNHNFSLLIVDDEPHNIQLLGNILKQEGYNVEFATSGEEALDWVNNEPFDLILLDVMMPGMNGYEVCKTIKDNIATKHIPIIFLTAKTESGDVVRGFEAGGSDYITKPFQTVELLARVKVHVEMKILRGLLPICARCKDIRNDQGTWSQIEAYLQEHSALLFSHSLCPKCVDKLYGDESWYKPQ